MVAKLLAVPASHACASAAAMLDAKGVGYTRRDLPPALSRIWLRARGFPGGTVPALRLDNRRIQGTRAIARELDAVRPEPPFFPPEPSDRARVEEIEAWADTALQGVARRIVLWSMLQSSAGIRAALEGARLPLRLPNGITARLAAPVIWLDARLNGASSEAVRRDLTSLPTLLDDLDEWMRVGELGRTPPTVADYQVAGSIRMLLTVLDLEPLLNGRPCAALAMTLIPSFPGRIPAGTLPRDWLH